MNVARPFVSVVVTTYNRPHLLKGALDSVVRQTDVDMQIIVVNDAGKDVSSVLRHFSNRIDLTLIDHRVNLGLAAARNTGVDRAVANLVAFLDDDDEYCEHHLSGLAACLAGSSADVAYSDARYVEGSFTRKGVWREKRGYVAVSGAHEISRMLVGNFIPVNAVLQRREVWSTLGGFNEALRLHEDWDYWIRASVGHCFSYLPAATCIVRKTSGQERMTSNSIKVIKDLHRMYLRHAALSESFPGVQTRQIERLGVLMDRQRQMIMHPERNIPLYIKALRRRVQLLCRNEGAT